MARAVHVLGTRDLFLLIVEFQNGTWKDFIALKPLQRVNFQSKLSPFALDCRDFWVSYARTDFVQTLELVENDYLTPWYRTYGLSRVLRYIDWFQYPGFFTLLINAVHAGRLPVVQFLHHTYGNGCDVRHLIDLAACGGHLEIVGFLHYNGYTGCTTSAMDGAAALGHIQVVQFLHEHRNEGCSVQALDFAAQNGHLETVKFLHINRDEGGTPGAIDFAAQNGHFEVAHYLSQFEISKPSLLWMRFYWAQPGKNQWRHFVLVAGLAGVIFTGIIMAFVYCPWQIDVVLIPLTLLLMLYICVRLLQK
ncbi:hypothetical protein THRCLA_20042 [Thraustotheca clavata]|uniref:Uncharacterized protein n=1 Tax=Thraustotheca clavata TaxID=74557 RepID=A0A1W0ACH9_9STRA|nr:hypothetical protein THRCLA_20042 [Thraustotheca clavata]